MSAKKTAQPTPMPTQAARKEAHTESTEGISAAEASAPARPADNVSIESGEQPVGRALGGAARCATGSRWSPP